MRIDWWTLGLQTINILVLVWLLAHFLFRPIAAIIAERKALARKLLDEAEEAKTAARAMREQADGALRGDRSQSRRRDSRRGGRGANRKIRNALDCTERNRTSARERRRGTRARPKGGTTRRDPSAPDVWRWTLRQSSSNRLPEERPRRRLRGGARASCRHPTAGNACGLWRRNFCSRSRGRSQPRRMSLCRRVLANAFGHPLDLQIEVDPALIAGLELENQHTSVRNSFRADLARIATEFAKHDSDVDR